MAGMFQQADARHDQDLARAAATIADARRRAPMIHCITAAVSMSIVADGLLAAGVRPMMTETVQEAPAVTRVADALLVNFGTLSTDAMAGIPATVDACRAAGHPWVLDPTAIGAAPVRTRMSRELLAEEPAVVRGNASEVMALTGGRGGRGADSRDSPDDALRAAALVASLTGGVVAVSGAVDVIVGAGGPRRIGRGTRLLTRVTGTGCLLGGLVAACAAVAEPFDAADAASVWLDVAGELAASRADRPGAFRTALLDALDEVGEAAEHFATDKGIQA